MSSKSEIEETGMNDDELYEGSKERQEFEGAASGEIKDTRERKQTMKGREYKKETLEKDEEHAVLISKNTSIQFENF